ncbi:MAG: plastocyanin/azurin family copper-binding protein [Actinomycetota bacterium]
MGRLSIAFVVGALAAAACSTSGDERTAPTNAPSTSNTPDTTDVPATTTAAPTTTDAPTTTQAPTTTAAPTTTVDAEAVRTAAQINDYVAEAAAFDQAGADGQFPQGLTFAAGGAPGYSRYVFRETSAGVVPTLVEGPLLDPIRCQDEALPCSYLELQALRASGAPIPPELAMTPDELSVLVGQLDTLAAFADAHRDVNAACAAGFISDRIQTANMGSHFYKPDWINDGFDPARPEILLYARADGQLPNGPVGQCRNGVWEGEPMTLVGTSFVIPPSVIGNEHPETFAGPLDNWHIHYNLCRGRSSGRDTFGPRSECEASGGSYSEALGWMLHAWVDPFHDNQLGVFSMWNSTIAPALDSTTIRDQREVRGSDFPDGAEQSLITDFVYSGDLEVGVGQPLFFNNVDAVPHTVTAGTPSDPSLDEFDSGLLNPGSNYSLTFDEPGVYSLFCTLHPDMVANVTVD